MVKYSYNLHKLYNLHNSYNVLTVKSFFTAYEKIEIFFLYIKTISKYQKHKERFWKEARQKYQNLSEVENDKMWKEAHKRCQNFTKEDKEKKCQYYHEHDKNCSEEQMQKLFEYRRNYYITYNK